jgi:hypothetical protein
LKIKRTLWGERRFWEREREVVWEPKGVENIDELGMGKETERKD